MIRLGKSVFPVVTDSYFQGQTKNRPLCPDRGIVSGEIDNRTAEQGLRKEPITSAQAEMRRRSHPRRLRYDITRGAAAADHKHAFAAKLIWRLVVLGMDVLRGQFAGIIRPAAIP